jgi:putative Holliday junction resolvase
VTETLTLIGFDYGKKRIGVAVGQTLTRTATPLGTVPVTNGIPDWDRISKIIQEWRPAALVVGLPLNMDGTSQAMTRESNRFVRQLSERYQYPVYRADERLSSYEAKSRLQDTRNLDPVAAQAILETWLSEYPSAPAAANETT